MATLTLVGDGVRTKYSTPLKSGNATATVAGSNATIASQNTHSVTFSAAPAAGAAVVITYTSVNPSVGTAAELEAGTSTVAKTWDAKAIHDEVARQITDAAA